MNPFSKWLVLAQLVAVGVVAAGLSLAAPRGLLIATWAPLRRWIGSERRALFGVVLFAFGLAALSSAARPPLPKVHDEFSYLLAADTFAQGRLTNPPHPFWEHFETFHVLAQPSRQSKYPPGQALFMAAGQVLTGRPIVGVWLALAISCGALYWCLRFWTPRRWAVFGALLPAIGFGSATYWRHTLWAYWSTTYWGGSVALLGGALTLGAAARLMRRVRRRDAGLLGLGLTLLAMSRPFEGLLFAASVAVLLLPGLARQGGWKLLVRALAPTAVVVAVGLGGLGYYNWRVTGSALTPPYLAYVRAYDVTPFFTFQELTPEPDYRHDVLRRYHLGFMVDIFEHQKYGPGLDRNDTVSLTAFLLGPVLALLTPVGLLCRDRWRYFMPLTLAMAGLAHAFTQSADFHAHYLAPFVPGLLLITVRGLRVTATWKPRGRRLGSAVAQAAVIVCAVMFLIGAALRASFPYEGANHWAIRRRQVADRLLTQGGEHLIFVRYAPGHNVHREWVYNLSEIDRQPIVWAREMSPEKDRALAEYFCDRRAWVIEADVSPPRLSRYVPDG